MLQHIRIDWDLDTFLPVLPPVIRDHDVVISSKGFGVRQLHRADQVFPEQLVTTVTANNVHHLAW